MTGADLEQATRVEGEDGRYVAQLSDAWEIWGPNGGYLAAIALRAAGRVAQIPDRRASTAISSARPRSPRSSLT